MNSKTMLHFLTRRSAADLRIGSPESIYRADPNIGVFATELDFVAYLRYYECHQDVNIVLHYGGIEGERVLAKPVKITHRSVLSEIMKSIETSEIKPIGSEEQLVLLGTGFKIFTSGDDVIIRKTN